MFDESRFEAVPAIPQARMGLAVTSLILGVLAVFLSFALIGGVLGVVGIVLGALHLGSERQHRAMAGWGLALSIVGVLLTASFVAIYAFFVVEFLPAFDMDFEDDQSLAHWEGVRAPDMTLPTLDGEEVTLSELKGKRVIIDMGATWDWADNHLVDLAAQVPAEELVIIAVSDEEPEALREFAEESGITYALVSQSGLPSPFDDTIVGPTRFFIDRNGVIQTVLAGYQDDEAVYDAATAEDFAGTPLDTLPEPRSGLLDGPAPLVGVETWSLENIEATLMTRGDWDGDGTDELLLSTWDEALTVIGFDGAERATVDLPEDIDSVRLIRHVDGPRLLGYTYVGDVVTVMALDGTVLWTYKGGWFTAYIDDVIAGDVDGDGNDEILVSMMNGLHLLSEDGKRIWRNRSAGTGEVAFAMSADGTPTIFSSQYFSIHRLDGAGEKLGSFGLGNEYCDGIIAASVGTGGDIRIMIDGEERLLAADGTGKILWTAPMISEDDYWSETFCAGGDIDGDGTIEWVFPAEGGSLVLIDSEGVRLGAISEQSEVENFAMLTQAGGKGLVVTLVDGTLQAFAFEAAAAPEVPVGVTPEPESGVVGASDAAPGDVQAIDDDPVAEEASVEQ